MRGLPEFNDLVRQAMDAQEAFDNWDEGATWHPSWQKLAPRVCTLDEVVKEWHDANEKLIQFVLDHGEQLLRENRE
jgi:hypothetical protein